MTTFLTAQQISEIHRRLLNETGGARGTRDKEALESATLRPQTGYYADTVEMAAALIESIAINHPFTDGNKRTAIAAADIFLMMNGHTLDLDDQQTYKDIMNLFETGNFNFVSVNSWLRDG